MRGVLYWLFISDFPDNITITGSGKEIDLTSYEKEIEGYAFEDVKVDDAKNGESIEKLVTSSKDEWWSTKYYIQYVKKGETQGKDWFSSAFNGTKEGDIYFVYSKDKTGLKIDSEHIMDDGAMKAVYTEVEQLTFTKGKQMLMAINCIRRIIRGIIKISANGTK